MQLTAIPVEPQGGGAVSPKPAIAANPPVIHADAVFAEAYVGADTAEFPPENAIAPDTPASSALHDVSDVPNVHATPPNAEIALHAPAPQSATKRGIPVSSDAKGVTSAPAPSPQHSAQTALNARAVPPQSLPPIIALGAIADAPGDPAAPEVKAPPTPTTHASDAPDRPVPPRPETDDAARPKQQDPGEMIRPQQKDESHRRIAKPSDQPARKAAPLPSDQMKLARVEGSARQEIAPKAASLARDRRADIAASAPNKPAASATQPRPAPDTGIRMAGDAVARPDADLPPAPKPQPATRDWQQPLSDRRAQPDAPVRPKPRDTTPARETNPFPKKLNQTPVITRPSAKAAVELPVRHSVVVPAAHRPTTPPAVGSDHAKPQSTPAILPKIASADGEITVEIVTRPTSRQPAKVAGRQLAKAADFPPSQAANRPTLASPRTIHELPRLVPASHQPSPNLPQPTLELPHPTPTSPRLAPASPQSSPISPQPSLETPRPTPASPRPVQAPPAQGFVAQAIGAETPVAAKTTALDRTPRWSPQNQPTLHPGRESARQVAASQTAATYVARAASIPVAPNPPLAALPEKLNGSLGQSAFDSIEQILTFDGPGGPASTDRAPSLGISRGVDAGLARAELARSVAAQIGDAARATTDGKIEVRLSPEELGRVRLSMTQSEVGLVVTFAAERPETLDLIRRHTDIFAQDLRHLGHQNINFSFEQGTDNQPFGDSADTPGTAAEGADASTETGPQRLRTYRHTDDGRLDIRL